VRERDSEEYVCPGMVKRRAEKSLQVLVVPNSTSLLSITKMPLSITVRARSIAFQSRIDTENNFRVDTGQSKSSFMHDGTTKCNYTVEKI
jgi:hypothetical protein